jgi:putative FmdB family regulatory protein
MPLREYECVDCGAVFEKLVRNSSEGATVKCPVCGSLRLEEKFSAFASVSKNAAGNNCAPSGG